MVPARGRRPPRPGEGLAEVRRGAGPRARRRAPAMCDCSFVSHLRTSGYVYHVYVYVLFLFCGGSYVAVRYLLRGAPALARARASRAHRAPAIRRARGAHRARARRHRTRERASGQRPRERPGEGFQRLDGERHRDTFILCETRASSRIKTARLINKPDITELRKRRSEETRNHISKKATATTIQGPQK